MSELYRFQREEGVPYLAEHERAYLAYDMGLGKSVVAAAAARRVAIGLGIRRPFRALALAPASTLDNWRAEWEEWGPAGSLFVPISYASRELRALDGRDWDLVLADEAHYMKNPTAKRTLRGLDVLRRAPRAWLLSGTPMPNHPGELYTTVRVLWPEICRALGLITYDAWFDYFTKWTMTKYGKRPYANRHQRMLNAILQRIMLRRTLAETEGELDLPKLRVDLHRLPYDSHLEDIPGLDTLRWAYEHEKEGKDPSESRARRLLGEYKAPRIAKVIDEELRLGLYRQVVLLGYHRSVLDTLERVTARHGVVRVDGSTPVNRRQGLVDQFTHDPSIRVFIGQMTATGVGLNLQAAHEVVLVEPDWVPDVNRQAIKRIHRIGQKYPSRARLFAVRGTMDEGIMKTIAAKARMGREVGL